ncbi:beta-N-acetylhexosaminidase [Streptomyces sp. NPDC005863]|uniref:beta-N-acetylhexosaminidase n=1 Tax=unclassified Streptomyces TaxID=2593676 RepID=UPI0033DE6C59
MPAHRPAPVPHPTQLSWRPGHFTLDATTTVRSAPGARPALDLLRTLLAPATGLPLPPSPEGQFVLALDPQLRGLGEEGYGLTVGPDALLLRAAHLTGLLRGVQTVRQLLPVRALSDQPQPDTPWELPCAEITDVPQSAWRGFMLDVARHFQPAGVLRRYVDLLALHKMNVLHLHLTDDQGWRMPVAAYPRLTEVGGRRAQSMVGPAGAARGTGDLTFDGVPHQGAYSRDELTDLVTYAAARGVTVMPEMEMPGHVRAALAAYPELGNTPGRRLDVWTRWGVCDTVLGVGDPVLDFCRTVLDEVLDVFPSPHVHIGGDECPTTEWAASPAARARAAAERLPDTGALREWFLGRIGAHLIERGRTPTAWAETGEGLPPEFTVMTWRDPEHTRIALKRGHAVVSCHHRAAYLDYPQSHAPTEPPGQPGAVVDLRSVHAHEAGYGPDTAESTGGSGGTEFSRSPAGSERSGTSDGPGTPDLPGQLLGLQAQLWTEFAPTADHVDYLTFPRLCALADRAWHGAAPWPGVHARLRAHAARLAALGLRHGPLDDPYSPAPKASPAP